LLVRRIPAHHDLQRHDIERHDIEELDSERRLTMNPVQLPSGIATGIGGLPHRDASEAAAFVLQKMELPAIPTLPRRSPAEGSMAQAMVGMQGITVGQYGSIAVDANLIDPLAPIVTDLEHDAFLGFRTFLDMARSVSGWRSCGPACR
jgi:hypothetical protein